MKRRVLKAGRSSLAISIPKNYVESNGIRSGQEIDVIQHGATLTITCENPKPSIKIIDISDLSPKFFEEKIIDKIIGALFKQGGDNFEIKFHEPGSAAAIREIIRKGKLSMYEEPSAVSNNSIIIHSPISQFDENTLNNMTNAIIKHIYLTIERLTDSIRNNYLDKAVAEDLISRDRTINEHSDICKRIINKNVLNYKSTSQYSFVDRTEKIGDAIKDLVNIAYNKKAVARKHVESIDSIKNLFFMLLNASTNFTVRKMNEFYDAAYAVEKRLKECKDNELYHCLETIITIIKDSYSDLMVRSL